MTRDPASVVLERTVELARVPAPPLDEADRAEIVTGWWRRDGLEPHIDPVGNVVARLRAGPGPAIFVAAHLDTVFGRDVPHGTEQRSGRLHGVGVGDNTVAVAALSVMDRLLPQDLDRPVWIAATVGEEGFGNLTGARYLVERPPAEIGAMVALEGKLPRAGGDDRGRIGPLAGGTRGSGGARLGSCRQSQRHPRPGQDHHRLGEVATGRPQPGPVFSQRGTHRRRRVDQRSRAAGSAPDRYPLRRPRGSRRS